MERLFQDTKQITITIIYLSMFLDNILLTVVVPIIPDFLLNVEMRAKHFNVTQYNNTKETPSNVIQKGFKTPIQLEWELMESENGPIGMLLSSKAIIQLIINPFVGHLTGIWGYNLPMFIGTFNLLIAALLYAYGETYTALLFARSIQGVASAFVAVSGLCLAARLDTDEQSRAHTLGLVLGSVALGVLSGYPLGGFLYDFVGKAAPFLVISIIILVNLGLQLQYLDLSPKNQFDGNVSPTKWSELLSDKLIVISACAIWISTSALAVLEPCLPIWLMENLHPEKWQLGTVFIPDSFGYLIGAHFFGVFSYKYGRWRVALASMIMIGICTFIIPTAASVSQLLIPHFGLGLGIGIIDSALVPLLAHLVDTRHQAHYGSVYALQQIAVSLSYSVGPILGGEFVKIVGFPWVIRTVGIVNFLYCPLLIFLNPKYYTPNSISKEIGEGEINTKNQTFYNSTISTCHNVVQKFDEELPMEYTKFQDTCDD